MVFCNIVYLKIIYPAATFTLLGMLVKRPLTAIGGLTSLQCMNDMHLVISILNKLPQVMAFQKFGMSTHNAN